MPHLDFNDLNYDLYFEFYLQEDFYMRYTYSCKKTEYSLAQLCKDITHQIYNQYRFKKFTGFTFDSTFITFGMIASFDDHCIMDIYQNDRYAKDFPLNLLNVESHFSHQLYLNLLIVFSSRIEPKAFRELLYPFAGLIRSKSTNPIWPVLYEDQPYVSPYIEAKINRFNNRLIVVDRYKKMESPNDLKTKLANDLLRFQQKLDNTTNKTLQIYDAFLRIVHKDNLNQLKAHENNRRILITEMIYSLIDTNENLIKFCYGEVEHMSEEQIIEYIKYFTLTHLDKTGKELNLSLMKYHYRKRYNAIMEMKNKIVESILAQIEKLND